MDSELAELIEDARSLASEIEFLLDDREQQIAKASLFASELAEVLYKARLIELRIDAAEAEEPDHHHQTDAPHSASLPAAQ